MIKQIVSLGVASLLLLSAVIMNTTPQTNAVTNYVIDGKVTICHRTAAANNPYVTETVSVNAVDGVSGNNGQGNPPDHYDEHQGPLASSEAVAQGYKDAKPKIEWGDIIPPTPAQPTGLNWTTEGQAIYNNSCNYVGVTPLVATAAVSTVPATCTTGETLVYGAIVNATFNAASTPNGTTGPVSYTVIANAAQGAAFAAGLGVTNNNSTLTLTGTLAGPNARLCPPVATPCVPNAPILVTNQNEQGFNYSATRVDGRYTYVDGALFLETLNTVDPWSSTNKVSGVRTLPTAIPVTQYGGDFEVDFMPTEHYIEPGVHVLIDADNDGDVDVTLIAEPNVAGYLTFWTNVPGYLPATLGGQGGNYAGDQNDLLGLWPNAVVRAEAFSLGGGVPTDGNLISWSTPCNTYTYDHVSTPPVVLVATAAVSTLPATCEAGEQLVYGALSNATFNANSTANGTTGPADYSVTANAAANAKFAGNQASLTFTGDLDAKLTGADCVLGEETPTTTEKPASTPTVTAEVLPNTNAGSATTIFGFVAGLLTVIGLGGAVLRKTLYRGL